MQITLDALTVVDAIATGGSFSAAAEALHKTTPAVTYSVQKLERELGVAIFDRSGHRAVLTPAGEELLTQGRQVLRSMGDLQCRLQRIASGWESELTIAVGEMVLAKNLFALIDECQNHNRNTRIRLANECTSSDWVDSSSKQADLIIGAPGGVHTPDGYAMRSLADIDISFVVATSHPLAKKSRRIKCDDVIEHRIVIVSDSLHEFPAGTPDAFLGRDVLSVPDLQSKYEAILSGLGVGYLPTYMVEDDIKVGRLLAKHLEELKSSLPLIVQWRTTNPGKTLDWFLENLQRSRVVDQILVRPVSRADK